LVHKVSKQNLSLITYNKRQSASIDNCRKCQIRAYQ
jgi:hypothetical protein